MTTIRRLTSASLASWLRIGITLFAQIFLLPVYLSYWDKKIYGIWLAIQAAISLATLADGAHQNYLGFEFLKIGEEDTLLLSKVFSASMPISWAIGSTELRPEVLSPPDEKTRSSSNENTCGRWWLESIITKCHEPSSR